MMRPFSLSDSRMSVLVTGFEAYLGHRRNPTQRLVREADGRRVGGARLVGRVLPVDFEGCGRAVARAIREAHPQAIVMFGMAPTRTRLSIEAVALNVDHSEDPDNAGRRRWRRPIERRGPPLIEATLPIDRMYRALRRAKFPVGVSYHAGTYVCNHAFYVASRSAGKARVGFVHVPKKIAFPRLLRALEVLVGALQKGR